MFSKRHLIGLFSAGLLIAFSAALFFHGGQSARAAFDVAQSKQEKMKRAYGRLPMSFEVNQGQVDESVKFISRGHGYQVFLTDT
ncbi:MAG: hypothetical protein ACRD82_15095, partial [Blastocatellia bacterium]